MDHLQQLVRRVKTLWNRAQHRHVEARTRDSLASTLEAMPDLLFELDGLGLDGVAVGVETDAQRNLLLEYGCRVFQGDLVGRPQPLEEFEAGGSTRP